MHCPGANATALVVSVDDGLDGALEDPGEVSLLDDAEVLGDVGSAVEVALVPSAVGATTVGESLPPQAASPRHRVPIVANASSGRIVRWSVKAMA
ncbi:hypothetical protein GCM10027572_05460 [Flexivirga lutea]